MATKVGVAESDAGTAAARPGAAARPAAAEGKPRQAPLYHVVLLDDDHHSYAYVIEMLGALFGHGREKAYQMAEEVDRTGRVIVDTTTLERAEFKRDQIHGYGADPRIAGCKGSMSAEIEPAE